MITIEEMLQIVEKLKEIEPILPEVYTLQEEIASLKYRLNDFNYTYNSTYYNTYSVEDTYFNLYGSPMLSASGVCYSISFKDFFDIDTYKADTNKTIIKLKDALRGKETARIAAHIQREKKHDITEFNRLKKKLGKE